MTVCVLYIFLYLFVIFLILLHVHHIYKSPLATAPRKKSKTVKTVVTEEQEVLTDDDDIVTKTATKTRTETVDEGTLIYELFITNLLSLFHTFISYFIPFHSFCVHCSAQISWSGDTTQTGRD